MYYDPHSGIIQSFFHNALQGFNVMFRDQYGVIIIIFQSIQQLLLGTPFFYDLHFRTDFPKSGKDLRQIAVALVMGLTADGNTSVILFYRILCSGTDKLPFRDHLR